MDCFVFDLDGTLADPTHRLRHIQQEPKDWRSFFADVGKDDLIEPVAKLLLSLDWGTRSVILSGRSDECRDATMDWLDQMAIPYARLYMRREGDHRPDHIVKQDMLKQLLADGYRPILFIDDRDQVVNMWRELGYTCLQCAPGNF